MEGKTLKQLNAHYYGSIAVLAVIFLLLFFKIVSIVETTVEVGLGVESYAIAVTLLVIPLSLKLFSMRVGKIAKSGRRPEMMLSDYRTAYIIRLYVLVAVAAANIILHSITGNTNFAWLAAVVFVAFAFCKSSADEIYSLTTTGGDDNVQTPVQ